MALSSLLSLLCRKGLTRPRCVHREKGGSLTGACCAQRGRVWSRLRHKGTVGRARGPSVHPHSVHPLLLRCLKNGGVERFMVDLRLSTLFQSHRTSPSGETWKAVHHIPRCHVKWANLAAGLGLQGLPCHRVIKAPWRNTEPEWVQDKSAPWPLLCRNCASTHPTGFLMTFLPPAVVADRLCHHFHIPDSNLERFLYPLAASSSLLSNRTEREDAR